MIVQETKERETAKLRQAPCTVALVGNPNSGKTTLFNRLTGTRQRVGNYPGITVEKKEGRLLLAGQAVSVVDLPGAYSLAAHSADERLVAQYLSGRVEDTAVPDVLICVVDAGNLLRNLYLVSQAAETGIPLVLALNMIDEAQEKGIKIDCDALSRVLRVPVVPTVACRNVGVDRLKEEGRRLLAEEVRQTPALVSWPACVNESLARLRELLPPQCMPRSDAELLRLLFDAEPASSCGSSNQDELRTVLAEARKPLLAEAADPFQVEAVSRYAWLHKMLGNAGMTAGSGGKRRFSERIDAVLTHKIFGLLIFLATMFVMFYSIYRLSAPFMAAIDGLFRLLAAKTGSALADMPVLQKLIAEGVLGGVGSLLVFLPQILILFVFIALLEDSGYMARAAYLMDRLFSWCGLSGKSFVPMLSSFACAVPGIMAARTIDDPKARLTTSITAPLMSCSARLPIYVLLIGALIEPAYGPLWAAAALFGIHFLGFAVAIPLALIVNRWVLRGESSPFVLEMPPYRLPRLKDVVLRLANKAWSFLTRAGTVVLAVSIIVWVLSYFPHSPSVADREKEQFINELAADRRLNAQEARRAVENEENAALQNRIDAAYLEHSILGRLGKQIQPVFAPAGFDWKMTVALLAGFPARELMVSTMGILYRADASDAFGSLEAALQSARQQDGRPLFTPAVAAALMIFVALSMQCGATLATLAQESGIRWALAAFVFMSLLAWLGAVLVYQLGSFYV